MVSDESSDKCFMKLLFKTDVLTKMSEKRYKLHTVCVFFHFNSDKTVHISKKEVKALIWIPVNAHIVSA